MKVIPVVVYFKKKICFSENAWRNFYGRILTLDPTVSSSVQLCCVWVLTVVARPMGAPWRKAEVLSWLSVACTHAGLGHSPFTPSGALVADVVQAVGFIPAGMNEIDSPDGS